HFVRGYFDGDGSVYLKKSSSRNKHLKISFLGTKDFLSQLKRTFTDIGYSSSYLKPENNYWVLTLSDSSQLDKVISWMYQDAKIFMERKKNKCLVNTHLAD
ncbi:MAG: LAGLIDADG family homing endonuclease, partial [Xenococcus sp. (in: cyanobacteria)]